MDIANRKNHSQMIPCPRSYGFVVDKNFLKGMYSTQDIYRDPVTKKLKVRSQFDWFMLKNDLLLAEECREIKREIEWNFSDNEPRVCTVLLFEYLEDDVPDRYQTAQEGFTLQTSLPFLYVKLIFAGL